MSKNVYRSENVSARTVNSVANPVGKVRPIMTPLGSGQVTMVTKAPPQIAPDLNPGSSRIIKPSGGPWIVRPYLPPRNSVELNTFQQQNEDGIQGLSSFQIPSERIPPNTLIVPSIYAMYPNVPSVRPLRWVNPQQTVHMKEMVNSGAVAEENVAPRQQQQAASDVTPALPIKEKDLGNK